MDLRLQREDKALVEKFFQLKTIEDICDLLEIDKKTLVYYLYRKRSSNYKVFLINKRSGGKRSISAPVSSLKIIQRKLSYILNLVYKIKPSAHGFCLGRSIVTNASTHSGKPSLLNIDLENFFPSINFGRVRGLFMSKPFSLSPKVATVLAQICISDNELPQGAPTSPIVSNLICSRLDGELQKLAKQNKLLYTRYADDITFSTWRNGFPENIATKDMEDTIIGTDLKEVIESNGFNINKKKNRLSLSPRRQIVTGLVVNKFPNVKRDYIREIRVILHNLKKYGIDTAEKEYYLKRGHNDRNPHKPTSDFKETILGKINFIGMVRGHRNCIYRKFINKYNSVLNNKYPILSVDENRDLGKYVWIIEVDGKPEGTGFLLDGYGLVTANHVLNLSNKFFAYRPSEPDKKYAIDAIKKSSIPDLAIMKFKDSVRGEVLPYFKKSANPVQIRDLLFAIGFPLIYSKEEPFFYETKIAAFKEIFFVERFILDKQLFTSGMSGSPLLNNRNEVVGVLATGAENFTKSSDVIEYTAIPIKCLDGI